MIQCFKRFDASITGPPQKSASSAVTSYGVDTNWYMDSGATDHVTGELEKLTVSTSIMAAIKSTLLVAQV